MYSCTLRNGGDLELLDPELHSPELLKCVWEDAITDIAVVRSVPNLFLSLGSRALELQ